MMSSGRYTTGQEMLQRVNGHGGEAIIDSLQNIAPDFARYLVGFPFGDIYARSGLDLRNWEIATIAVLTALGDIAPRPKVHTAARLGAGLTQEEVTEVIIQMAVYTGFPAALNGLSAAEAVFTTH